MISLHILHAATDTPEGQKWNNWILLNCIISKLWTIAPTLLLKLENINDRQNIPIGY